MRFYTRIDISPNRIPPKSSRNASVTSLQRWTKKQHIARGAEVE
jgi:hypothetical protein